MIYTEEGGVLTIHPPPGYPHDKWKSQFRSRQNSDRRPGQSCWEGLDAYVDKLHSKLIRLQADIDLIQDYPDKPDGWQDAIKEKLKERRWLQIAIGQYRIVLGKQTKRLNELVLKQSAETAREAAKHRKEIAKNREAINILSQGFGKRTRELEKAVVSYARTQQGMQRQLLEMQIELGKPLTSRKQPPIVHRPPVAKSPWNDRLYAATFVTDPDS